jgi:hypothetical protein
MDSIRRWLRAPVAVLVATLAIALAACSGGGDSSSAATSVPAGSTLTITPGSVSVQAAGPPGTLSDGDRDAIAETLKRYVVAATIDPLRGKAVGDLGTVFTPEAVASIAGPDGAAVIDKEMPKATGTVKAHAPPVPMTALSDPSGAIDLVGTTLFLDVRARAAGGPVRVQRNGELVLRRAGSGWKIASYRLTVDRSGSGLPAATTSSTEGTAP